MTYNVVWYWVGGTDAGKWKSVSAVGGETLDDCVRDIERMGYVAVKGHRDIGRPEGPPSAERIARALSGKAVRR